MKKLVSLGVLVGGLLILAGCGSKVNLSFDDAYQTFSQNLFVGQMFETSKMMMEKDYVAEHVTIDVHGENDTKLDLSMSINSESDVQNMNSQSDIRMDFSFLDQATDGAITGSGNILMAFVNKGLFVNLKDFALNMGEGNAEGQLFSLILQNFVDKWIKIDHPEMDMTTKMSTQDLFKFYNLPNLLTEALSGNMIFENQGEETYEKYQAYKVSENTDNIQKVVDVLSNELQVFLSTETQTSDVTIKPDSFSGYLVVKDTDHVDLVITNLEIVSASQGQSMLLTGVIGNASFDLYATDVATNQSAHIVIKSFKKRTTLLVQIQGKAGEDVVLDFEVTPTDQDDGLSFVLDGTLEIQQAGTEQMSLDISGEYMIEEIQAVSFTEPANYLLMSQIFGDENFVPGLMGDSALQMQTDLSADE